MYNEETKGKKNILFLCSPNLGILDNWLPVLYRIKQHAPHINVLLFLPKASIAEQINRNNVLVEIAEEVFSDVVVYWYDGKWKQTNSMLDARTMAKSAVVERFFYAYARKFESKNFAIISGFIRILVKILSKYVFCRSNFSLDGLRESSVVVYDVYEETKPYRDGFFELVEGGVKKYSISHGIDINCSPIIDRSENVCAEKNTLVYLFSREEVDFYQLSIGVPRENMQIVGVPRHDDDWVRLIQNRALDNTSEEFFGDGQYVVLFSRSISSYLPLERKIKALQLLKKYIIDRLDICLVIKLHPKEVSFIHIFYEVFGKDNLNKTWKISELHPFALAKLCKFAVVFYSGVSIDMNYLGVPVIEYLDMNDLEEHDNQQSIRINGNPCFSYRYLGFVHGASNEMELEQAVYACVNDNEKLRKMFRDKYDFYFPKENNLSKSIANTILTESCRDG